LIAIFRSDNDGLINFDRAHLQLARTHVYTRLNKHSPLQYRAKKWQKAFQKSNNTACKEILVLLDYDHLRPTAMALSFINNENIDFQVFG